MIQDYDSGRGDWNEALTYDRVGLSDLYAILRRRQFVLGSTFLFLLLAVIVYVVVAPREFAASAVVMVPTVEQDEFGAFPTARSTPVDEVRLATTMELMKSRSVAEQLALSLTQELGGANASPDEVLDAALNTGRNALAAALGRPPQPPQRSSSVDDQPLSDEMSLRLATEQIMGQTSVRRIAGSRLLEVWGTARSPEMATKLANGLADTYQDVRRNQQRNDRQRKVNRLREQVEKARIDLYNADLATARYMRENNLITAQGSPAIQNRVSTLESALANAQAESVSRRLNQLLQEEAAMQDRLGALSVVYGPGYPEIVDLRSQIAALKVEIQAERDRVREELQSRRANLDASAAALSSEIRAMRRQHFDDLVANAGLLELERKAAASAEVFKTLLDRLQRAEAAAFEDAELVEVVARAIEPTKPVGGSALKTIAIGAIGAWMLAIFAAFAAEALDRRVRSADHVRSYAGAPTFAMVPRVKSRKLGRDALQAYVDKYPTSEFVESMRNLFLELRAKDPTDSHKTIVVTSVGPGDGKSTIANGLAKVAAEFDYRPVVVSLDRKSQVAPFGSEIDVDPTKALGAELPGRERTSVSKSISPVDFSTSLTTLHTQLDELSQRWNFIIVEAPPILRSRDAKALAPRANAILVVMEWGAVQPGALRAVRRIFDRTEFAAVINRVNYRAHARLGYGDAIEFVSARA